MNSSVFALRSSFSNAAEDECSDIVETSVAVITVKAIPPISTQFILRKVSAAFIPMAQRRILIIGSDRFLRRSAKNDGFFFLVSSFLP